MDEIEKVPLGEPSMGRFVSAREWQQLMDMLELQARCIDYLLRQGGKTTGDKD